MTDTLNRVAEAIALAFERAGGPPVSEQKKSKHHWICTMDQAAVAIEEIKRCEIPGNEQLVGDVEEYLHWRKVNPQIKGGENYLKRFRESLTSTKRESSERAKTKDLVNMIRMKLERRFQTADYMPDSYAEPHSCRGLVTDMCQDFMTHVREIHTLAERALNSIEGGQS